MSPARPLGMAAGRGLGTGTVPLGYPTVQPLAVALARFQQFVRPLAPQGGVALGVVDVHGLCRAAGRRVLAWLRG
jgi:hypothetical protein